MLRALRRTAIILAILTSCAALGAGNALARGSEGSVEIGPYVSFSRFSNTSGIEESLGGGMRVNLFVSALHSFEFDLDGGSEDHEEPNLMIRSLTDKIGVHFMRNYTPKGSQKSSPFVAFGVGRISVARRFQNISSGVVTRESDGATYLSAAGGVRFFFTPRVALRVGAKTYRWRGDGVATPRESFFSFDLTVGVSFLLRSEGPTAPPGE
jgi:hypothetical protein